MARERRNASRKESAKPETKRKRLKLHSVNLRRANRKAKRRSGGVSGAKGRPYEGAFEDEDAA
jgi:hypothetical protein